MFRAAALMFLPESLTTRRKDYEDKNFDHRTGPGFRFHIGCGWSALVERL
jgi:hypothetical protein